MSPKIKLMLCVSISLVNGILGKNLASLSVQLDQCTYDIYKKHLRSYNVIRDE